MKYAEGIFTDYDEQKMIPTYMRPDGRLKLYLPIIKYGRRDFVKGVHKVSGWGKRLQLVEFRAWKDHEEENAEWLAKIAPTKGFGMLRFGREGLVKFDTGEMFRKRVRGPK